jgi:hypothetical protein
MSKPKTRWQNQPVPSQKVSQAQNIRQLDSLKPEAGKANTSPLGLQRQQQNGMTVKRLSDVEQGAAPKLSQGDL